MTGQIHPPATSDDAGSSVRIEGGHIVIRIPIRDGHAFRVALAPCPCKATKSHATEDIRERMSRGLGRTMGKP